MFRRSHGSGHDKALNQLFDKYKEERKDVIGIAGTEQLCADLEVDPSDVRVLAFAWRLGASKMCHFTRDQWAALRDFGVKSVADMKRALPKIMDEAIADFKSYYEFTYTFGLDVDRGERTLPAETAIALWRLVFSDPRKQSVHLDSWLAFLEEKKVKGISKDTWDLYLVFTETIDKDCTNYDAMEAWPSLLDEYVEHLKGGESQ
ncbi:Dcun1d3 protein [Salpingoeca rosetta]|uniref:Defective in cullin neddylation protein n=1 Tax=Salpingoeca rosetta (strain ATCC 50818 / BSB-021) TaxID=946362 RepID=F2UI03_SALR5|nr:Dcun1d3 protein [Salpingoeca rosetta]EGD76752.1 Dcun1d3 protein [Salpingoeca rosetta]|eukprot:XP_004991124.1 Dcun1d3 protein [Salpingoeca rosetta]